jgi:hypothetical protein
MTVEQPIRSAQNVTRRFFPKASGPCPHCNGTGVARGDGKDYGARCWCGRLVREHINGQRCTRWLP